MKMEFDLEHQLAVSTINARFDWHGLRARLAANHAARVVIEGPAPPQPLCDGGSFDRSSARALAVYGKALKGKLDGINLTALANGKPNQDNVTAVAGERPAGD
jgi:hypothetical protein